MVFRPRRGACRGRHVQQRATDDRQRVHGSRWRCPRDARSSEGARFPAQRGTTQEAKRESWQLRDLSCSSHALQGPWHHHVLAGSAFGAAVSTAAVSANNLGDRVKVAAADSGDGPFHAIAWDFGGSVDRAGLVKFAACDGVACGRSLAPALAISVNFTADTRARHTQAMRSKCVPEASVLPARIVIQAALVQSETLWCVFFSGFPPNPQAVARGSHYALLRCSSRSLLNGLPNGRVEVTEKHASAVGGSLGDLSGAMIGSLDTAHQIGNV